jgi:hypothetical protein
MSYPYPGDGDMAGLLADIGATPAEQQHLREVLAEVEAEEAYGEPEPSPYGPWDDFNDATAQMDQAHALDAQRMTEDIVDGLERRPSTETILAQAMRRIEAGTYTEPEQFRSDPAARDGYGQFASACGPLDDATGTCGARYHAADCGAVIAAAAATGDAQAAEAWRDTLASRPPDPGALGYSAELAEPSGPEDMFSGLLSPASADSATVHQRMLAVLADAEAAEPGPEPFPREQYPDTAALREAMGL